MNKELEFLKKIVNNAIKFTNEEFEVKNKGEGSDLVTNIDYKIEKYFIDEIKREYPNFDIVSEEFNSLNNITDNCFVIDPIDGTINFANNLGLWAIQVCCIKDGVTVASVISIPCLNEFYYADETGAYLNDKKISVNVVPIKNALFEIDGVDSVSSIKAMQKYSFYKRNLGSLAVAMAFLASGRLHGVVFKNDSVWDYEPGLFICKMAGASICSRDGFHCAAMNDEFLNALKESCEID